MRIEYRYGPAHPGASPRMTCPTRDEAVLQALNAPAHNGPPPTVEVITYAPRRVETEQLNPLERLLETLDEEYGDPTGCAKTEPTPEMKQAEQEFVNAVVAKYRPNRLRPVMSEEIDVARWTAGRERGAAQ